MIGVHQGAVVGQAGCKVGERIETQPGQQAGADEGLEEPAEVVEAMLPPGILASSVQAGC